MKIKPETTIAEIVSQYPELIDNLHKIGLYCFSWGGRPAWGTLALQAKIHGIKDMDALVQELNDKLNTYEKYSGEKNEKEAVN